MFDPSSSRSRLSSFARKPEPARGIADACGQYCRWCFSDPAIADVFRERFGGAGDKQVATALMSALGQRATYRHVVIMSDMPLTTDVGVHAYWVIRVARCHGET